MKNTKKILSIVLALVIVLGMMPITAFAASRFPEPNGGTVNGYKRLSWVITPDNTGEQMYERIQSEIVNGGYVNSGLKQHTFISKGIPASAAAFDENAAYLWQDCKSNEFSDGTYYIYGFGYGININYLIRYEYIVNVTIGYSVGISVSGTSGSVVIDGKNYSGGTYVVKPGNSLSFTMSEITDNTHIPTVTFDGKELSASGGAYTVSEAELSSATDRTIRVSYPDHDWQNGFCTREGCNGYQPAPLSDGAYQISNAGQLYWFADHVLQGNYSANAVLTNDITVNEGDLSTLTGPNASLRVWMPLGKKDSMTVNAYKGTFDGQGHTVNGLYYYTDELMSSEAGVVANLGKGGCVKNLTVAKSWFGVTSYAGAIVGSLNGGTIDNCHNESFVGGAARIGGIVGHISSGTVSNCSNSGKVCFLETNSNLTFDPECIGGIAGNNSGLITMCVNHAPVTGGRAASVAGIAGQCYDGTVKNSINLANISGSTHTGGVAGWVYNSSITNSANVGNISGSSASASLSGGTNGAKFSNCYYVGDKATGYSETVSGATKITVDQLYSGEIAYSLGWGQTLDGSSLPYPGGPVIYRYYTSTGAFAYTNDANFSCNHKDGTATCMEPAVCSGCKQPYGEKNSQNHVGSDDGYYINPDDTSTHFQGCPCGEKSSVEKHDWNRPDGICEKCNALCGVDTEHNWYYGYCPECQELMPAEMDTDGFYMISTLGHLAWFAEQVNSGYNTINGKLTSNINTSYYLYNNYEPIGKTDSFGSDVEGGFAGIFDGQGYYIYSFSNMGDVNSDGTYGIFGTVADGGIVRNLKQYSAYMSLGDGTYDIRAGLIAGQVSEGGLIENCYVEEGTLNAPKRVAGGITGLNLGTVKNCYTYDVEITAYNNRFGGIVGDYQGGKVINCYTSFSTVGSTASGAVGTMEGCEAGISEERFYSGEIAYKLNGGVTDGTQPYYQKLNDSKYKYLPGLYKSTSNVVYGWVNGKIELYSNSLSFTLSESVTFGKGEELNIPEGATISVAEGVILDVHADTAVEATFTGSGHVYYGGWIYFTEADTNYHYRICAVDGCEETQQLDGTHTGGEADCTNEAVCDYCKAYYGGFDENNHDWQADGICSRCKTETTAVAWVDSDGDGKLTNGEQTFSMLNYPVSAGVSVKLFRDISDYFGGLSLNNQSVTVDLNGHTWNADTLSLQMSENATLTITDSSAEKSGKFIGCLMIHEAGNSIVLDGVSAELVYAAFYNGTFTINGGHVSGSMILSGGTLDISNDASCRDLTIENGTSAAITVNIPKGHVLKVGSVDVTEIPAGESAILSYLHDHKFVNGACSVCGELCTHETYENGICENGCYEPASLVDGVYQIGNLGQLMWFSHNVSTAHKALLTADITIDNSVVWTPIALQDGTDNSSTFNGGGHTITFANTNEGSAFGLFEKYNYSVIENLYLAGSITCNTASNVGVLVNSAYRTTIRNVISTCDITNSASSGGVGGLAGQFGGGDSNGLYSLIENCAVYADISGGANAGGLIGNIWGGYQYCTVRNCAFAGNVAGGVCSGAIVGNNGNNSSTVSTLENVYFCETDGIGWIGNAGSGNPSLTKVEAVTAEQFASGEVAYLLGSSFGQNIGKDAYPTLGGATVYEAVNCIGETVYANTDENGFHIYESGSCTVCGEADPDHSDTKGDGDVNGDGAVNSIDSNLLKRIIAGVLTPDEAANKGGDLDGDGTLSSIDSNLLSRLISGAN